MNTHELAKKLLQLEDKPFSVSVDVSTGEDDACERAFGTGFIEIIDSVDIVICFDGYFNNDK